jgi:hypothetical protein
MEVVVFSHPLLPSAETGETGATSETDATSPTE